MRMETMYANYCEHGFMPEHAQVATKKDFNAVRKVERALGQAVKELLLENHAQAGKPLEISRVTVREDKSKQDGSYIPRAVFFTYTEGDDRKKTKSHTFASIASQMNARMPAYERAKARYEQGVDIDGERVYREVANGVVWYIAQEDPGEPPGTNDPASLQAVVNLSKQWEEAVASLIRHLDVKVSLQSDTGDVLHDDDYFEDEFDEVFDESEFEVSESLIPKGLGAVHGSGGSSAHGTKGEVWYGEGWNAWKVDTRFYDDDLASSLDRWAKHFAEID